MKKTLTLEQTKRLLAMVSAKRTDKTLVTALLLCGGGARTWTWEDALSHVMDLPLVVYGALKELAISKRLTLIPFNHQYFKPVHWVGTALREAVFTCGSSTHGEGRPLTTQEVTRRLKLYAQRAGIDPALMSLRTLVNTHHLLIDLYGDADALAEALPPLSAITPTASKIGRRDLGGRKLVRDGRLHGINRRSSMKTA